MKRAALLLLAACVPSAPELDAKGGALITTIPSPASRGEAFVTSDGWTVQVESLVALAFFSSPARESEGGLWLFHASQPIEAGVRALPVGETWVWISLAFGYDRARRGRFTRKGPGVTEADEVRLGSRHSAAAHLRARAEGHGRIVILDTTLDASFSRVVSIPLTVAPNQFARGSVGVDAKALFESPGRGLEFDEIAGADADRDGTVIEAELRAARARDPFLGCPEDAGKCRDASLHASLSTRTSTIWVQE